MKVSDIFECICLPSPRRRQKDSGHNPAVSCATLTTLINSCTHVLPDFNGNSMWFWWILRLSDEEFIEGYQLKGNNNQLNRHCFPNQLQHRNATWPGWALATALWLELLWRAQYEFELLQAKQGLVSGFPTFCRGLWEAEISRRSQY